MEAAESLLPTGKVVPNLLPDDCRTLLGLPSELPHEALLLSAFQWLPSCTPHFCSAPSQLVSNLSQPWLSPSPLLFIVNHSLGHDDSTMKARCSFPIHNFSHSLPHSWSAHITKTLNLYLCSFHLSLPPT